MGMMTYERSAGDMMQPWCSALIPVASSCPIGQRDRQKGAPRLNYYRNRYYDQQTGRFINEDPIGIGGGANLYQYSGNNPATFSDPFGLCAGGDSITVIVTVCENGHEVKREVHAAVHSSIDDPGLISSVNGAVAGMSWGGSAKKAELGNQAIAALGSAMNSWNAVAVFPTTYKGNPVLAAAGTGWSGDQPYLALRSDVAAMIQSGQVNAFVPVTSGISTVRVCHALGHEGVHMVLGQGSGEGTPTAMQGGFRCQ